MMKKEWIPIPVEREPGDPLPRGLQHCDGDVVRVMLRNGMVGEATVHVHDRGCYYYDPLTPEEQLRVARVWGDPTIDRVMSDPDRERESDE
jgi:hypothetical protein